MRADRATRHTHSATYTLHTIHRQAHLLALFTLPSMPPRVDSRVYSETVEQRLNASSSSSPSVVNIADLSAGTALAMSASRSSSRKRARALDSRPRVRVPAVLSRTSSRSSTVILVGGSGAQALIASSKWCCQRSQRLPRAAAAAAAAAPHRARPRRRPLRGPMEGAEATRGGATREGRQRPSWCAPARPSVGHERPRPRNRPPRALGGRAGRIRCPSRLCCTFITLL
jgi:hypothetical protein